MLNPDAEVYAQEAKHTFTEGPSRVTCGYCGKSFRGLTYLDVHFATRHPSNTSVQHDRLCLADQCDSALLCPPTSDEHQARRSFIVDAAMHCDAAAMVARRRQCESRVADCLDDDNADVRERVTQRLCQRLSCEYFDHLEVVTRPLSGWRATHVTLAAIVALASLLAYGAVVAEWADERHRRQAAGRAHPPLRPGLPQRRDYTDMLLSLLSDYKPASD